MGIKKLIGVSNTPFENLMTTLASESGTQVFLVGHATNSTGLIDLKSTVDGDSANDSGVSTSDLEPWSEDTNLWFRNTSRWDSPGSNVLLTGAMTIRCMFMYMGDGTLEMLTAGGAVGESSATNWCWTLEFLSSSTVNCWWETGSGSNRGSTFTLSSTLVKGTIYLLSFVREDNGDGTCDLYCYQNGTRCNVSAVSGMTNNTTHTTGDLPTGGTSGKFYSLGGNDTSNIDTIAKFIQVMNVATTHATRESEVAALLGLA